MTEICHWTFENKQYNSYN